MERLGQQAFEVWGEVEKKFVLRNLGRLVRN